MRVPVIALMWLLLPWRLETPSLPRRRGGRAVLGRGEHSDETREAGLEVFAAQADEALRALGARADDARLAQELEVVGAGGGRDLQRLGESPHRCWRPSLS